MPSNVIKSISVSGLITLDMHSLNNEGAEGNYLLTREVQIADSSGDLHAVNAISGDMLKHIQAEHLFYLAHERQLPLCNACSRFDANRIVGDAEFAGRVAGEDGYRQAKEKGTTDSYILTRALQTCTMDDAEGVLITSEIDGKNRAIARKSVVEFGWLVGRPESTRTESYFHVKYVPEGRGKGAGDESGANVGQNIFHRPASSGQYALVLTVDLFRLGRNDITLQAVEYTGGSKEARQRKEILLESVLSSFIKPTGAHRNTQNPHIVDFVGCLALSRSTLPAPMVSALNAGFIEQMNGIASALNRLREGAVEVRRFDSQSEFAAVMADVIADAAELEVSHG